MDAVKNFVMRTLIVLPFAVAIAALPAACEPQPAARSAAIPVADAADLREANQAWERVYGGMSDEEKIAAVVLEPVSETGD